MELERYLGLDSLYTSASNPFSLLCTVEQTLDIGIFAQDGMPRCRGPCIVPWAH